MKYIIKAEELELKKIIGIIIIEINSELMITAINN